MESDAASSKNKLVLLCVAVVPVFDYTSLSSCRRVIATA